MVDQDKKSLLEQEFAGNFAADSYSDLVDIYIEENNLAQARKVCEIGLSHHPGDKRGLFLLSQVFLGEGNLEGAEKLLQVLLVLDSGNIEATHFLVTVQERLNRPQEVLKQGWLRLLEIDPDNQQAKVFLKRLGVNLPEPEPVEEPQAEEPEIPEITAEPEIKLEAEPEAPEVQAEPEPAEAEEPAVEPELIIEVEEQEAETEPELEVEPDLTIKVEAQVVAAPEPEIVLEPEEEPQDETVGDEIKLEEKPVEEVPPAQEPAPAADVSSKKGIKARMATFTLVAVLKDQGLYHQALEVLEVLEQKDGDMERIASEREAINQLIQSMAEE